MDIKSHLLFSIFLVSFLPTIQHMFQDFFSVSSLLFAFTPPAVISVAFPEHEADKEQGRA